MANTCAICGATINVLQSQKLMDGNYICTKGCRAKGLKYYDYVHSDLDNVKDHIHQTEVGTKIWQDLMEPLKKTRDKNQKMQSFHPIYIAPSLGLIAVIEARGGLFNTKTYACVYRLENLQLYRTERMPARTSGSDKDKMCVHLGFVHTKGLNDVYIPFDDETRCHQCVDYLNKLFGLDDSFRSGIKKSVTQFKATKSMWDLAKAKKNGENLEEKAYSGKVTIFSQAIFSGKKELYDRENSGTNTIPRRIAVAKDEAFCFYYRDNLRMLEHYGAELVFFSPLHDEKLPENIHGLLLGGGYPELYAKQLEENESMRKSIKEALEQQLPSLAECGGFMYLHDTLTDREGTTYQMAGVIPAECQYTGKLVRFGYVEVQLPQGLTEKGTAEMPEPEKIKAHEFHYFDSTANGEDCIATKPVTGRSWKCIHASDDHFWGFPHLYYPSDPKFVEWFLERTEKHI